jgi:hypothetical protein
VKSKLVICAAAVIFAFAGYGQKVQLVKVGNAAGTIVLLPNASPSEQLAAKELVDYIKKISGVILPKQTKIVPNSIVLGTLGNLKNLPAGVKQRLASCKSDECFYIKTDGNKVYIVGKKPIGVLYGAYTFLEKLGVRWLYPGPQGEVYPKRKTISINNIDDFETPSLAYRSVSFTCASYNFAPALTWMARNKMTVKACTQAFRLFDGCTQAQADFFNAARNGIKVIGGHSGFQLAIPADKYFKTHPEYFALLKGKRVCKGRVQRCLSNPDVQKIYEDMVYEYTKNGYHYFFGAEDAQHTFCQCDNCRKMGTVDGKYKETNLVHSFFSRIASRVLKRNPDAKYFMHIYNDYRKVPTAGDIKYPPAMLGAYCSHGRCYVHEFNDPECASNKMQYAEFRGWQKFCPNVYLRDYIQVAKCEYAPFEYIVGKDIKNLVKIGAAGWTDECPPAYGRLQPRLQKQYPLAVDQWLSNWPTYYVAAQVGWDSKTNTDKLMTDAYTKYYGEAAEPMLKYQALRRKLWENAPGHAFYGGPVRTGYCLTVPGAQKQLETYLKNAKKAAGNDKLILERIAMDEKFLKKYWENAADKLKKLFSAERQILPQGVNEKIIIDGKLNESPYVAARPVTGFISLRTKEAPAETTNVRVLYDKDNLYFGIVADAQNTWGLVKADALKRDGRVWGDDSVELQIAPPDSDGKLYHIVVNTKGVIYDSRMNGTHIDKSFDSKSEVKVKKVGKQYIYEIRVPLSQMNAQIVPGQNWRMHFIRNCRSLQPPVTSETSTIDGTNPHQLMNFRQVSFGKNIVKNGNFAIVGKYKKTINGLDGNLFPKYWGISSGYCRLNKTGNGNTITFKTGTIYSYLGIFSRTQNGKLTITVNALGNGEIYGLFRTWVADEVDYRKRLNQKNVKTKIIALTKRAKTYTFQYNFTKQEQGYFYLYVNGEVTVNNINGVITAK